MYKIPREIVCDISEYLDYNEKVLLTRVFPLVTQTVKSSFFKDLANIKDEDEKICTIISYLQDIHDFKLAKWIIEWLIEDKDHVVLTNLCDELSETYIINRIDEEVRRKVLRMLKPHVNYFYNICQRLLNIANNDLTFPRGQYFKIYENILKDFPSISDDHQHKPLIGELYDMILACKNEEMTDDDYQDLDNEMCKKIMANLNRNMR